MDIHRDMTRLMQANLNHAQAAHDLLTQWSIEKKIELAAIQEPWSTLNHDYWFRSKNGLAAIYWNRGVTKTPCRLTAEGKHLVAVKYKEINLISCYSSPNATQMEYEEMLNEISLVVSRIKSGIVLCGDFNAKSPMWSSKIEDKRGRELIELANMLDLRLVNVGSAATCVRTQGSSIVDITWSSADMISKISKWKVEEDEISLSDHRYITFEVVQRNSIQKEAKPPRIAWSSKKFDLDLFHSVFTWECPQMLAIEALEQSPQLASMEIDGIMKRACDAAMPRQSKNLWKKKAAYWWSSEINEKRKECIRFRRKWKKERRKTDSDIEKEREFKVRKKELRILIRKAKISAWKDLMRTIEEDPWGLPYRIVMSRLRRTAPALTETLEKRVLDDTLSKLFPNSQIEKGESIETINDWQEEWDVSVQEVIRYTHKRKTTNTAPGMDGVKSLYWKQINGDMITCVAKVLTICIRHGIFPDQWKLAQLVLIPKGVLNPENPKVRPICLLPEIGKIFERVLAERMYTWMEEHTESALSPNQFGFRRMRSTVDAIVELREFIEFAHKEDGVVIAVAIDITNAFNSLQWADIMTALKVKNFPLYIQKIIDSYLSNRMIMYTDEEGTHVTRTIEAGVPQGSVLGPLLWNITFDKVLKARMENGCRLLAYADDTLIISTGESVESARRRMALQVARTSKNIKDLKLEIAASKTEIVVFTPKRKSSPIIEITINRQRISSKKTMKYLGVIMDEKLTFSDHMEYVSNKVNKITRALWRLMPNLHGPTERRRRLYANVLSSIILYAAPVWAHKGLIKGRVHSDLKEMHRATALRVIAAYRTVSQDAAAILSRIPPYYLTADARKRAYERIRDLKIAKEWTRKDEKTIIAEETDSAINKWKEYLTSQAAAGTRTREAIIPIWHEWLGRSHGNMSFHLTQILTGHGVFYSYLNRIKKANTDRCPHCNTGSSDTVEHTLLVCAAWDSDRAVMLNKTKLDANSFSLKSMVKVMVDSRQGWTAVQTFVEKIMFEKEEYERQTERGVLENSDPEEADDEDSNSD